jgi:hypothetical protein
VHVVIVARLLSKPVATVTLFLINQGIYSDFLLLYLDLTPGKVSGLYHVESGSIHFAID